MTLLPIVARELRVSARRRSTYRVRSYAALVVLLGGIWLFLFMREAAPKQMAETLFSILTGCAVFFGLVSGCFATADCLSQEKREGTLGLLFLTDLRGYDVVLGKLAASSLNAFYTMAAVVPLMAVPLILGGLTAGDFLRTAIVALVTLFFSLAAGVFISSMCRSSSRAVGLALLLVGFFTALLPMAGAYLAWRSSMNRDIFVPFLLPSPFYAYALASDQVYRLWAVRFWCSIGVLLALSGGFLGLASIITPRVWQDRVAQESRPTGRRARWRAWWNGSTTARAAFRHRLLPLNPIFWLTARARYKPVATWFGLGIIAAFWFWGLAVYERDWLTEPGYYIFTGFCAHLFLRVRFASEVPWQLAEERKGGTLELLLCTPLSVRDIILGQQLALRRQFLGPVGLVLILDLIALLGPGWAASWSSWSTEERWVWTTAWAGAFVLLALDLWALFWVGLWQGLTAKTALRASSNALGNVYTIPCVFYALFLLWMVMRLFGTRFRPGSQPQPWMFFAAWFGPRLFIDLLAGFYAREKLLTQFRLAAQVRRDPSPGHWGAWLARAVMSRKQTG